MADYNKLRLNTDSPFLKGEFPNPLKGAYLSWMTTVSDALQGSNGDGKIKDHNGVELGKFKSFGGLVMCTLHFTDAGDYTFTMPSNPFNLAPVFLSDGQTVWGTKTDNIWTVVVTVVAGTDGYSSYWS